MHKHIINVAMQKNKVQSTQLTKKQANESIALLAKTDANTQTHIVKYG